MSDETTDETVDEVDDEVVDETAEDETEGTEPEPEPEATSTAPRVKKPRHRASVAAAREFRDRPGGIEIRRFAAQGLEVRAATDGSDVIDVRGTPIVYNAPYDVHDMFGTFSETMAPGVCSNVLTGDVRFLFNHDGLPLARTVSGTLCLEDTAAGLNFAAQLDARQSLANDLGVAIERGDVSQMSCGFIVENDAWNADMTERTIFRFADLLDVSAVTYPASPTTTIAVAERMMLQAPVESRARVRRMWSIAADLRDGSLTPESATLLADGLETLHAADDRIEGRDTPTAEDPGITAALQQVKADLQQAITKQAADPDAGSDPIDAKISNGLADLAKSLDAIILDQAQDGAPDARSADQSSDEDPDGTNDGGADAPPADGSGVRSIRLELELEAERLHDRLAAARRRAHQPQ